MKPEYLKALYDFIIRTPDKVSVACAAMLLIVLSLAFYVLCKRKNGRDAGEMPLYVNSDGETHDPNKLFIVAFDMECEPKKYFSWRYFCKDNSEVFEPFESQGYTNEIMNHDRDVESSLDNENGNVNYLNQTWPLMVV